jgi:S1-C subfamily serine protease
MMKRFSTTLAIVLIVALASPVLAGEGHKCTASTQECLNKMAQKMANYGWTGLDGDYNEEKGIYTVTSITADSPAGTAGVQTGDILFAINGQEFADMTDDDWKAMKSVRVPGATVTYTLKRDGSKKEIDIVLAAMPEDMVAKKIGKHMMEHATVASVQ